VDETSIKEEVRDRYAREALKVRNMKGSVCCGSSTTTCGGPINSSLYTDVRQRKFPRRRSLRRWGAVTRRR
jgi:hypothetical protein